MLYIFSFYSFQEKIKVSHLWNLSSEIVKFFQKKKSLYVKFNQLCFSEDNSNVTSLSEFKTQATDLKPYLVFKSYLLFEKNLRNTNIIVSRKCYNHIMRTRAKEFSTFASSKCFASLGESFLSCLKFFK